MEESLMRFEIRRDRLGHVWFRCRRCKEESLPHYSVASAQSDRDAHHILGCLLQHQ